MLVSAAAPEDEKIQAEILIIDDDRNLRETLRDLLEGAGYRTRTAAKRR